jgi:hypothetical protein
MRADGTRVRGLVMMATNAKSLSQLETEAAELAATEILVETNEGTFGESESLAACGTGDKSRATYRIFERVGDGRRRASGFDASRAPGYTRYLNGKEVTAARQKLRAIREQIDAAKGR